MSFLDASICFFITVYRGKIVRVCRNERVRFGERERESWKLPLTFFVFIINGNIKWNELFIHPPNTVHIKASMLIWRGTKTTTFLLSIQPIMFFPDKMSLHNFARFVGLDVIVIVAHPFFVLLRIGCLVYTVIWEENILSSSKWFSVFLYSWN